jgi:hypothetical protein
MQRAFREPTVDLTGVTDRADLPLDCRTWVAGCIGDTSATAVQAALEQLLAELATRFAAAPDDLGHCDLMQAVAHGRAIHVTEEC